MYFSIVPPIRSCREYYDRCNRRRDGVYRLTTSGGDEESYKTYCDMSRNKGGWTLLVTSKMPGTEWTSDSVKSRNGDNPSLKSDFSILSRGDEITSIANGDFEYRLEAGEPGQFGGIWRAPSSYKYVIQLVLFSTQRLHNTARICYSIVFYK